MYEFIPEDSKIKPEALNDIARVWKLYNKAKRRYESAFARWQEFISTLPDGKYYSDGFYFSVRRGRDGEKECGWFSNWEKVESDPMGNLIGEVHRKCYLQRLFGITKNALFQALYNRLIEEKRFKEYTVYAFHSEHGTLVLRSNGIKSNIPLEEIQKQEVQFVKI